jgi:hypothetical protein
MVDLPWRQLPGYSDAIPGSNDRILFEASGSVPRGIAPANLPFPLAFANERTAAYTTVDEPPFRYAG